MIVVFSINLIEKAFWPGVAKTEIVSGT